MEALGAAGRWLGSVGQRSSTWGSHHGSTTTLKRRRCWAAAVASMSRSISTTTAGKRCRRTRSEEHTSELQSRGHLVCRLLLEKKKKPTNPATKCKPWDSSRVGRSKAVDR